MACFRRDAGGILLTLRLTPRSSRDAIDGVGVLADGQTVALARVRAVPEDGAANAALLALVAKTFAVAKSAVTLRRGATQRVKQVHVAGDADALAAIIATWNEK